MSSSAVSALVMYGFTSRYQWYEHGIESQFVQYRKLCYISSKPQRIKLATIQYYEALSLFQVYLAEIERLPLNPISLA